DVFRAWWARLLRSSVSPAALIALLRGAATIDVRAALAAIRAPTLVLHRRGDRVTTRAQAAALATSVPSARLVELSGEDHLIAAGDTTARVAEIVRLPRALPA